MLGNVIAGLLNGIVLIIIVFLLIFLLRNRDNKSIEKKPDYVVKQVDLTAIEGIGPKIAGLLMREGVNSYQALALMETTKIAAILKKGGLAMADPATWPEQAALLADGKMKELEELQHHLKGGRLE